MVTPSQLPENGLLMLSDSYPRKCGGKSGQMPGIRIPENSDPFPKVSLIYRHPGFNIAIYMSLLGRCVTARPMAVPFRGLG